DPEAVTTEVTMCHPTSLEPPRPARLRAGRMVVTCVTAKSSSAPERGRRPSWKEREMSESSTAPAPVRTRPAPQPGQPPAPGLPEPTADDDVLEMEPTIEGEDFSRVAFTQAALVQIQRLIDRNGPLMFHQSGGCCDGSSPMCFPEGDFLTGDADV